jgi:hypothetical protein
MLAIARAVSPLIAAGGGVTLKYMLTTTIDQKAMFHTAKSLEKTVSVLAVIAIDIWIKPLIKNNMPQVNSLAISAICKYVGLAKVSPGQKRVTAQSNSARARVNRVPSKLVSNINLLRS